MMKFLRKYMKPVLIITTIGLVVGTFAMYGSNFLLGGANAIASVNGTKIPVSRYFRLLNQTIQNYRDKQKADPDEAMIKKMKDEIVRDFIQEELFRQEAVKLGIKVSKQEMIGTLSSYNIFHREGRFDPNQYYMVLKTMLKTTPAEFEEETRVRIMNDKLRSFIVSPVKATDKEIADEYYRENKGDMTKFEKEKAEFSGKFLNQKRFYILNTWFSQVGEKAKIKVFLDKIEKEQQAV